MNTTDSVSGPLVGIRVLDLTRVLTGPYCTMMLGDLGADVIKIERPGAGDDTRHWGPPFVEGESSYFMSINRNKRSVALDLKSDFGKEVLWKLIDQADIIIENFAPGVIDRLGFGHEVVQQRKPSIIYASISGFGQTGPSRNRTAYDLIVNGMSGMASVTGFRDGPPVKFGPPIADIAAGMFTATAITSALYARELDPERKGQYITTSMLGGQIAMLTYMAGMYFNTGNAPIRNGNRHAIITPYDTFPTADGYVNIAVGNDAIWQRFCTAMGMEAEAADPRYEENAGRLEHWQELYASIERAMGNMTTAEIVAKLDAAAVPCGPINTIADILEDPQIADQELRVKVPHTSIGEVEVTGFPYKFSETPLEMRSGPPLLGEHTTEVLRELGYNDADIEYNVVTEVSDK